MTQVSNQTQLLAALAAQDSIIQITDNFRISSQINILYPVTLESITNDDSTQILLTPINFHIQYENMLGAVNPNPATYTITTPTIELLPLPNLAGYRFLGWFDAATEGNRITSIPQGSSGDITLYAIWKQNLCGCPCPPPKATV